jgi:hypothetical protein
MRRVVRELRGRGVELGELHALELFGGSGNFHTKDYASEVASLEVWELDERYRDELQRNLPKADVRTVDTFAEISRRTEHYDLIVVDNPMSTYGEHGEHCEHFGLFPEVFRRCSPCAIVIVNVIPYLTDAAAKRYPYLFNREQLAARTAFYRTSHPEEISFDKMVEVYKRHAANVGTTIVWHFLVRRHFVYYLVMMTEDN